MGGDTLIKNDSVTDQMENFNSFVYELYEYILTTPEAFKTEEGYDNFYEFVNQRVDKYRPWMFKYGL